MALITNYPHLGTTDPANPQYLADLGKAAGLGCCQAIDKQQYQAIKTYLLALILNVYTDGEQDYTDWCALAELLKPYEKMPDWEQRAAYLELLIQDAEDVGVPDSDMSEAAFREALSCWCCGVSPQMMLNMEIFLLSKIFKASQ